MKKLIVYSSKTGTTEKCDSKDAKNMLYYFTDFCYGEVLDMG